MITLEEIKKDICEWNKEKEQFYDELTPEFGNCYMVMEEFITMTENMHPELPKEFLDFAALMALIGTMSDCFTEKNIKYYAFVALFYDRAHDFVDLLDSKIEEGDFDDDDDDDDGIDFGWWNDN